MFPLTLRRKRASKTDRRIGAKSNYFQHWENAGFQRAREVLWVRQDGETAWTCRPPEQGEAARTGRRVHGWGFGLAHARSSLRSEERRVGKECRSRWSPY